MTITSKFSNLKTTNIYYFTWFLRARSLGQLIWVVLAQNLSWVYSQDVGQGRGHGTAQLGHKLASKMAHWLEALVLHHMDLSIGLLTRW